MEEDRLLQKLENTALYEKLTALRDLYRELQEKQTKFCDSFCIHCQPGCGCCCEHFVPDVTPAEAEFLAFGLISEGEDEAVLSALSAYDAKSGTCPLYNKDDPAHHCTVYRFRPMICRLFGASAYADKNGRPQFRHCKWNHPVRDVGAEELESKSEDVVLMRDFGQKLEEEEVGETDTTLLPEALSRAIEKVRFLLWMEEQNR